MPDSFILHASLFDGKGGATPLDGMAITQKVKEKSLAWVHLDANHQESREWLKRELNYLDPLVVEALVADETRPRVAQFQGGVLLILRGVNLNEGADPEDMVSLRVWVDDSRIISLQRRSLKAVSDIQAMLMSEAQNGPKNAGEFVAMLVVRLLERMEPVFAHVDEALDVMEEGVIEEPDASKRQDVSDLRKQVIWFRRYLLPQRDALMLLRGSDVSWLNNAHKRHIQEALDRAIRYVEDLDAFRERAQVIKDELEAALNDRLNHNMYVLSVIAAIFLPLGFLTGLLGINVGGIPGAENDWSFLIFCGILIAVVVGQVALFRKMKWF
ncbi:MAG: zinc transporter ZntB [Alphaproteobacteria bacterium]|nr:zinc transporter ZntB [Alphaproteobacteria bacterium]|tara:strand:- start:15582 stop:16562 length:981 start_codon:yes stop_codon:yes gene_type:complete